MQTSGRILLGGLLAALIAAPAVAGPRYRPKREWQLEVVFKDPQRLQFREPGTGKVTTYWYMVYQVTNRTGLDVDFLPSVHLVTDTLQVVEAGANVHPRVYDQIAARHKVEYPFVTPPHKATGKLLQGEAYTKTTVAVFRDFDPEANRFTVYASGLSSEMKRRPNPVYDETAGESEDNPRYFLLRKTLGIRYDLPGDPTTRHLARPRRVTREWVMR